VWYHPRLMTPERIPCSTSEQQEVHTCVACSIHHRAVYILKLCMCLGVCKCSCPSSHKACVHVGACAPQAGWCVYTAWVCTVTVTTSCLYQHIPPFPPSPPPPTHTPPPPTPTPSFTAPQAGWWVYTAWVCTAGLCVTVITPCLYQHPFCPPPPQTTSPLHCPAGRLVGLHSMGLRSNCLTYCHHILLVQTPPPPPPPLPRRPAGWSAQPGSAQQLPD
jgi:hypothetical protein